MFYQKSEVAARAGHYDIIIYYDAVHPDGLHDPLGFLYLSSKGTEKEEELIGKGIGSEGAFLSL